MPYIFEESALARDSWRICENSAPQLWGGSKIEDGSAEGRRNVSFRVMFLTILLLPGDFVCSSDVNESVDCPRMFNS